MTRSSWVELLLSTSSNIAIVAMVAAATTWLFSNRKLATAYRIAILGFPRSGKTTLITALFAYLFRRGIRGASISPRGEDTILRINSGLTQLELGLPIKPTTDQDVFAYRAELRFSTSFFSQLYKLEIGDFPGEDTVSFTEQNGTWLHQTAYFDWAVGADAFIFVIDASEVMRDTSNEYVARQQSAFRAAWQRLQEQYSSGPEKLAQCPLLLVFTKADMLVRSASPGENSLVGLREGDLPESVEGSILARFADLIDYFNRDNKRFRVLFTSAYLSKGSDRLGIPELANYIMPRRTLLPVKAKARG